MTKDGGPVHPDQMQPGMSLRDYFAAKAMQALIQRWTTSDLIKMNVQQSFQIADAMLKAREK